ncbi:MAG TPA: sulfotransferase [Rhizomicrobium sp.]|jgi:hypothetical protein
MSFARDVLHIPLPSNRLWRERIRSLTAVVNPKPLFIFGNQKSGTTAIAGLLASATGKTVTLDFAGAEEPYLSNLLRGQTPLEKFVRRNAWAFSADIIKEPSLTFVAHGLMDHFDSARAVFVVRNPYDNIRSILVRQRLRGDLRELPARARLNPTWRKILSGGDLGTAGGHYVDVLAKRWVHAIEIFQAQPKRFITVRYEDFNKAKVDEISRLASALNLPVVADVTALTEIDYQRRDLKAVPPEKFFGDNYARISMACEKVAQSLGYEPGQG